MSKHLVKVTVDNRLRMTREGPGAAPPELVEALKNRLTYKNPQYGRLKSMGIKYTTEPQFYDLSRIELATHVDPVHRMSIPRGSMDVLREELDALGFDYEVEDLRSEGDAAITGSYEDAWGLQGGVQFPPSKLVLWDHQHDIIEAIRTYEQALVRAPTGSGKTSAVIAAIQKLSVPALVIMWDSGLLEQWQTRIVAELGIDLKQQGLIRGKTRRLRGITLAMQQTLNNFDEKDWERLRGVFGLVACDEVQRYAANTFLRTIDRFDAKYRVGVSANERRKDGKHFLVYSMFGPVRHEVEKQKLIDRRLIHEVEVYVVPTDFRADWYAEKRDDPEQQIGGQDFNRLIDEMQSNEARNALAVDLIAQCVGQGLPTLSFTHRVDHAKMIDGLVTARGIRSGLALGGEEWSAQFTHTVQSLRDGSYQVGCGTFQKLGVGHDIPTVAAGVTVTPVHNNQPFMDQVKGRICRTSSGKENARILVLWDRHVFGDIPLYNLKRWNQTVRVWCTMDKRWKQIDEYLKELKHGRSWDGGSEAQAAFADIFGTANR